MDSLQSVPRLSFACTKTEIYTDSNPLNYVLSSTKLSVTSQQWVNELADFNLQIHHKPGINHQDPDALSLFPENIHQYTTREEQEQSERAQTQSEN